MLLSTAILTHALCQAVERFANWWISLSETSPIADKVLKDVKRETEQAVEAAAKQGSAKNM